jgi:hypothetical protein
MGYKQGNNIVMRDGRVDVQSCIPHGAEVRIRTFFPLFFLPSPVVTGVQFIWLRLYFTEFLGLDPTTCHNKHEFLQFLVHQGPR